MSPPDRESRLANRFRTSFGIMQSHARLVRRGYRLAHSIMGSDRHAKGRHPLSNTGIPHLPLRVRATPREGAGIVAPPPGHTDGRNNWCPGCAGRDGAPQHRVGGGYRPWLTGTSGARADAIPPATPPLAVCSGVSGGGRTRRLKPAFWWRVDRPGDGGRNPRNAPACKNEENVMRGRGVSKRCRTNSKDDSPHKKAGNGICPVVAVLLHVALPTLPADAARLRS